MRVRWLPLIVLVLVGGCVGSRDDAGSRDGDGGSPASVTPPVGPGSTAGLVDLAALEAAGIRATRVAPELDPERGLEVIGHKVDLVAAGDALLSFTYGERDGETWLVRSSDHGRSWQEVDLPEASPLNFGSLDDAGELVVLTDYDDRRDYAWASSDGTAWHGGSVRLEEEAFLLASPRQLPDGRLVVGSQPTPDGDGLIVSADGGASWQEIDCPATSRVAGPERRCEPVVPAGRDLWLRAHQVSLDAGQTWQDVSVVPDPESLIIPMIEGAVATPAGGWLGSVDVLLDVDDPYVSYLVRSVDGARWEQVVLDPCDRPDHAGSSVSVPVLLGDRWLVAHTCTDESDAPQRSQLYVLDGNGARVEPLATVERSGASFGPPLAVGDTVVVPEIIGEESRGGEVSLLHLRP